MIPRRDQATENRANPKGIPYLYLATARETAIAEVRPWLGVYVSVAQLRTRRSLKVLNCTGDEDDEHFTFYMSEPDAEEKERAVWRDVDRAFSRPVTSNDHVADYAATQIIAELLRSRGLDGVGYRSSLGPGHNIALFDLDAAELINCSLFEVTSIAITTQQAANPYFLRKNQPTDGQEGGV
jgi:hypothetical protein